MTDSTFFEYANCQLKNLVDKKYSWAISELEKRSMPRLVPLFENELKNWRKNGVDYLKSYELIAAWQSLSIRDLNYLNLIIGLSEVEWIIWTNRVQNFLNHLSISDELKDDEEQLIGSIAHARDYGLDKLDSPSDWRAVVTLRKDYPNRVEKMIHFYNILFGILETNFNPGLEPSSNIVSAQEHRAFQYVDDGADKTAYVSEDETSHKPSLRVTLFEEIVTKNRSKFVLEPLESGLGYTLGNSLRRTLLSSIPGASVTSIRIDGVLHEFTTVAGVKEDVTELVLNIKNLSVSSEHDEPVVAYLHKQGPGVVTAADITPPAGVEFHNPDLHIATLNANGKFDMELTIERGRGYVSASQNKSADGEIGRIPVDSIYSPVLKVTFRVEATRVEQRTDFDRLIVDVETKESITPRDAVASAGTTLVELFGLFREPPMAPAKSTRVSQSSAWIEAAEPEEEVLSSSPFFFDNNDEYDGDR